MKIYVLGRKMMRDFLRLAALNFKLSGENCLHANLRFVSKNEIRTGRAGHVSLLNKRNRSKSEEKCAVAWAKIVLDEFDTKTLVSSWFY